VMLKGRSRHFRPFHPLSLCFRIFLAPEVPVAKERPAPTPGQSTPPDFSVVSVLHGELKKKLKKKKIVLTAPSGDVQRAWSVSLELCVRWGLQESGWVAGVPCSARVTWRRWRMRSTVFARLDWREVRRGPAGLQRVQQSMYQSQGKLF
jgi:hypothetical protein